MTSPDQIRTIETRMEGFDARFTAIDQRLDRLDNRLDRLDNRIDHLEARLDSNLKWLLGVILATWITTIGAIIGSAIAL